MKNHYVESRVHQGQALIDAIAIIEKGPAQVVFVVSDKDELVGLITNGDVRRHLLHGGGSSDTVDLCMNKEFLKAHKNTPREELLKLFDLGYNAIPLVDDCNRLVDFVTPDYLPPAEEAAVLARARAPVRIGFSGGGTDLTYYFMDNNGVVLNTSIALYAHATLIPREDAQINIVSHDIDKTEHYTSLRELLDSKDKGLLSSVVSVIRPAFGFDLFVNSDFPVGSGLGGSSAVATSVVAAFNEFRLDSWSTYEIAELSFQAERLCFGISGGWQDQYASAFGGFNLIEFDGKKNVVNSIRVDPTIANELEECLILCDTGIEHHSGSIHEQQRADYSAEGKHQRLLEMTKLCKKMHKHLVCGELKEFGLCLHDAWVLKHGLSSAISGNLLDEIYNSAINAGALGGKLLGAGGGGFFLFFVLPRHRAVVSKMLKQYGCKLSSVRFEKEGVTSWRTKVI